MRTTLVIASIILAVTQSTFAVASESIETTSVVIPLAKGWYERSGSTPVTADGPNGELLQVTIVAKRTQHELAEPISSLDALEKAAIATISSATSNMLRVSPLKSFVLPDGTKVHEIICQTANKETVFLGLVLRGEAAVILTTIEGPSSSGRVIADARKSVLSLRWK